MQHGNDDTNDDDDDDEADDDDADDDADHVAREDDHVPPSLVQYVLYCEFEAARLLLQDTDVYSPKKKSISAAENRTHNEYAGYLRLLLTVNRDFEKVIFVDGGTKVRCVRGPSCVKAKSKGYFESRCNRPYQLGNWAKIGCTCFVATGAATSSSSGADTPMLSLALLAATGKAQAAPQPKSYAELLEELGRETQVDALMVTCNTIMYMYMHMYMFMSCHVHVDLSSICLLSAS